MPRDTDDAALSTEEGRVPAREARKVEGGEVAPPSLIEGTLNGIASCFGVDGVLVEQPLRSDPRVVLIVDWNSFRRRKVNISRMSQDPGPGTDDPEEMRGGYSRPERSNGSW